MLTSGFQSLLLCRSEHWGWRKLFGLFVKRDRQTSWAFLLTSTVILQLMRFLKLKRCLFIPEAILYVIASAYSIDLEAAVKLMSRKNQGYITAINILSFSAVQIWDLSCTHSLFYLLRVYYKLTKWPAPRWLN